MARKSFTELEHYGVKGMKWGVRKDRSPVSRGKKFVERKCGKLFKTPYSEIRLSKKEYEHVYSEVQTWMKKEHMNQAGIFTHPVSSYLYTVHHDGKRGIKILSKRRIKSGEKGG